MSIAFFLRAKRLAFALTVFVAVLSGCSGEKTDSKFERRVKTITDGTIDPRPISKEVVESFKTRFSAVSGSDAPAARDNLSRSAVETGIVLGQWGEWEQALQLAQLASAEDASATDGATELLLEAASRLGRRDLALGVPVERAEKLGRRYELLRAVAIGDENTALKEMRSIIAGLPSIQNAQEMMRVSALAVAYMDILMRQVTLETLDAGLNLG